MTEQSGELFIGGAKAQTLLRDFGALRMAIRKHDSFAAEEAWERCERWLGAASTDTNLRNALAANRELTKQIKKLREMIDEYRPVIDEVDAMAAAIGRE